MVITANKTLREFSLLHPDAELALEEWYDKTRMANWSNITDVRQTFGYADYVGNERVIFNVRGNTYCLIAAISYKHRTVYIKFIGTHQDYDRIDAASIELS
ncbi:MAG: type II toxin-antitoxin system HigB family toxin [Candidatus Kapaibacteriota bacterium]|jgi:mRNA interferase HigB